MQNVKHRYVKASGWPGRLERMLVKYKRKEDGSLELDADGNPIPIVEEITEVDPPVTPPAKTDPAPGDLDISKLDSATQDYIKSLRKENGGYRTKAKTADEALKSVKLALGLKEDVSPEEHAKQLAAQNENQAFENAVLQNALEHGIPKSGLDYFKFLVSGAAAKLGEGEELSDAAVAALALEAKAKSIKPKAGSSADGSGSGKTPPPPGESGEPSVEEFAAMGIMAKSKLYEETPAVYERLFKLAKLKKLI
jgi:hypothetical protein